MSTVNICGIPHKVILVEDNFTTDLHLGEINYGQRIIRINKDLPEPIQYEALCHEMMHGILLHLGFNEQAQDEHFVQCLGNAIYQGFIPNVTAEEAPKEGNE